MPPPEVSRDSIPRPALEALLDEASMRPLTVGCAQVVYRLSKQGIDMATLAATLQTDGAASFVKSWSDMMDVVAAKATALQGA